jgi:hypothetical protein
MASISSSVGQLGWIAAQTNRAASTMRGTPRNLLSKRPKSIAMITEDATPLTRPNAQSRECQEYGLAKNRLTTCPTKIVATIRPTIRRSRVLRRGTCPCGTSPAIGTVTKVMTQNITTITAAAQLLSIVVMARA